MGKYIKKFSTHTLYGTYINSQDKVLPNVSLCEQEYELHYNPYDYSDDYLTTVALENGTISFNIKEAMETDMITSISYSTDKGETWTTTNNTDGKSGDLVITINVNKDDKVLWKGNATQLGYTTGRLIVGSFFSSTCEFDIKGNIMSLLYSDEFKGERTIENNYEFACLFSDCSNVLNAKDLSLPATTLADYCYANMFRNCTSLMTAPVLPATTLAQSCYYNMFYNCTSLTIAPKLSATTLTDSCYKSMFQGCTSLTTAPQLPAITLVQGCYSSMFQGCTGLVSAPELPAETLANSCYYGMFQNCTSLTTAPELSAETLTDYCYGGMFFNCTSLTTVSELPATTLASGCYNNMFYGCTSLTSAPELPATTLANSCYENMFNGCTNLETAPDLPATTLVSSCYNYMFNGCTSLNYIKAMFTTKPITMYTDSWVDGVSATGTFVKNSAATWNVTGINGVPTGWTIQTASN